MPKITPQEALAAGHLDQLRAYVVRLKKIDAEIDDLQREKSAIYKEARALGFEKGLLRELINLQDGGRYDEVIAAYLGIAGD